MQSVIARKEGATGYKKDCCATSKESLTFCQQTKTPGQAGRFVQTGRVEQTSELSRFGAARAKAFVEFVDPTAGIDSFLLAGIKRVALRANVDVNVFTQRRASLKTRAAAAGGGDE
jgi:hypothetical protein